MSIKMYIWLFQKQKTDNVQVNSFWITNTLWELKGGPLHIKGESWPSSYIWLLNKKSGKDMLTHVYRKFKHGSTGPAIQLKTSNSNQKNKESHLRSSQNLNPLKTNFSPLSLCWQEDEVKSELILKLVRLKSVLQV